VDLSGPIFVALAFAWAAYLIPKALRHLDDVVRGRSIDRFSHSMRVLARREPVSARKARLVVTPARSAAGAATRTAVAGRPPVTVPTPDEQYAARRSATRRATRRRRHVLALILLALVGVAVACALGRLAATYATIPAGVLVAWLVACRVMVRQERAWSPLLASEVQDEEIGDDDADASPTAPEQSEAPATGDPNLWDPVPVTLPTYVSKPPARRTVRTIDLDATGVWTSGRTDADAALAREADAAEAVERVRRRVSRKDDAGGEAVGS
jgi:hypothetical protein